MNDVKNYKDKIPNQLRALISCVNPTAFEFIKTCTDYYAVLVKLDTIFIKTPNEILQDIDLLQENRNQVKLLIFSSEDLKI